jgi:hypothetical protein
VVVRPTHVVGMAPVSAITPTLLSGYLIIGKPFYISFFSL